MLQAQKCPFGIDNCKGQCGRFIDADGDGYCDYTIISETNDTFAITKITHEDLEPTKTENQNNFESTKTNHSANNNNAFVKKSNTHHKKSLSQAKSFTAKFKNRGKRRSYNLLLWTLITFGAYFLSIILHKTGIYNKRIHRRIWNGLLLITFLVSGILGLVLVLQVNYLILPSYFVTFLKWHVDFGIVMAWVSIFHIVWHFKYFRNIFRSTNKQTTEC